MPEISIQGDKIHYLVGETLDCSLPTLLFIHGAGQSTATWKYQKNVFGKMPGFNFIAPDLPGRGGSGGQGYRSVYEYKDFVFEFIEAMELGELIIVGHSMGGGVAMLIAIEHPELLRACILVATGAKLSVAEQSLLAAKNNYEAFCEISPTRMYAENSPDELKEEFKKGLLNTKAEVCYWDLVACNEFNIMDDVNKIQTPTLIISADKDILTPQKYGEYLHQKIYGSDFHVISDSGHFPMQEHPYEFNTVLSNFLK